MRKSKLFCCFSVPLKNFLKSNNLDYELCALNKESSKTMWIYLRDEKLDNLLTEWANNKPT